MNAVSICRFERLDSTNEEAKRLARQKNYKECVIIAEQQTQGKGSHGRAWYSQSDGGLYYSLLLKPRHISQDQLSGYPLQVAQHISDLLNTDYQIPITIKPPNDLLLNHKKVGGILIESRSGSTPDSLRYMVIGIGININQAYFPEHLEPIATSLFQFSHKKYDKNELITKITATLINFFNMNILQ